MEYAAGILSRIFDLHNRPAVIAQVHGDDRSGWLQGLKPFALRMLDGGTKTLPFRVRGGGPAVSGWDSKIERNALQGTS
jgi:hypothetical protein